MTNIKINVSGLAGLRKDLRKLGEADSLREVRDALKQAAEIVAESARSRVPVKSGKARRSIRSGASGNKAYVAGGRAKVPYYGWLDFGSRKAKKGHKRDVGPWANSGKGPALGRFIYPALDDKSEEVARFVGKAIDTVAQRMDF